MIRWTGEGKVQDLESSVRSVLKESGIRAGVSRSGGTMILRGPEPLLVGTLFGHHPGVAWVAAGFAWSSVDGLVGASRTLARRYLRRGDRFSVEAETGRGGHPYDLSGAVTSTVLGTVKGARVSEAGEKAKFRVASDGTTGVVGVVVREGDGGVPTGGETVTCLTSGGMHSSVVAWMALLGGYRVRMVHAKSGDDGLLAVARLYSELSHRGDPRGLRLLVLEGGSEASMLSSFVGRAEGEVFGGFRRSGVPPPLRGRVLAPLRLLPEAAFRSEFESLGVKEDPSKTRWSRSGEASARSRAFGGRTADVSEVLDGLA